MPVLVRNTEAGPTVFSVPEDKIELEWQGAGDPAGNDSQYVPDDLLKNIQFSKMIRRGLFEIVNESEQAAVDEVQTAAHQARKDEAASAGVSAIEVTANNDLVQAHCIGPANKGNGTCGEPVAVKEKTQDEKPTLCPRHASLASQYALTEVDGKTTWVRTTLAPREKQSNTPQ